MEKLGPKEEDMNGPPSSAVSQGLIHPVPAEPEESALNTRIPESGRSGQSPDPQTHSVMLCKLLSLLEPQFPHLYY